MSPGLEMFDTELYLAINEILNIHLESEAAWLQAPLPVCCGVIGIHWAAQLARSTILASFAGFCSPLQSNLYEQLVDTHTQIQKWKLQSLNGVKVMHGQPLHSRQVIQQWRALVIPKSRRHYDTPIA